jgi:bifunctional DNA-binding transcriptional regulator/antitoxin component of YhaV-PrlF toxin-antitoxin module
MISGSKYLGTYAQYNDHFLLASKAGMPYIRGVLNRRFAKMLTLTVTAKGQVTFKRELLKHLGVIPGEKLEISKLPDGRISIKAAKSGGKIGNAFGILAEKNTKNITLSIEEIDGLTRDAWAGKK